MAGPTATRGHGAPRSATAKWGKKWGRGSAGKGVWPGAGPASFLPAGALKSDAVDRETFAARFREAAAACRSFASQYLEEKPPPAMRFRLRLNASYDGNPLHADEIVFPEDSTPERAWLLLSCDADEVVATLCRSERVPEWVNVNVVGVTPAVTLIEVLACGRFSANEELLYHRQEARPPFHVLGPTLPLNWVEGQRFSIYYRSTCARPRPPIR